MIINKLKKALYTIFQLRLSQCILPALSWKKGGKKKKSFVCATGDF